MTDSPSPAGPGSQRHSPDAAAPDSERERLLREEADALRSSRPAEVETAFRLWLGAIVLNLLSSVLDMAGVFPDEQAASARHTGTSLFFLLLSTGLWLFFVSRMRAGENWARIVLTVLTGLYGVLTVLGVVAVSVLPVSVVPAQSGGVTLVLSVLIMVIAITAVVMMFRSRASDYFDGA